MAIPFS
jgi:hypothetical protein